MAPKAVHAHRPRVLIAGAGVGALEAALALRALAGEILDLELVAPQGVYVYRAMSVAEPFGHAPAPRIPLSRLWDSHRVRHRRDDLQAIDAANRRARLASGDEIGYDALIVAVGARPVAWLPGAVHFATEHGMEEMRRVLASLEDGSGDSVLFAAAPGAAWTLPLYELALLTAAWCADHGVIDAHLSLATNEREPLAAFGAAASRAVAGLLSDRGVRLHESAEVVEWEDGRARLSDGARLDADAVVTFPRLVGPGLEGLPGDRDGFIPVDQDQQVMGVPGVYAVGDATAHPVKQGGLAAQEADVAASAIARAFGVPAEPVRLRSVLRGQLLTGVTAAYLRSGPGQSSDVAFEPLWWPPTKVAGRYLGPWLADVHLPGGDPPELADRAAPSDLDRAAADRAELRRLAIEMARSDAAWGDHQSALRWLHAVEWLDGTLPPDLEELREQWRAAAV